MKAPSKVILASSNKGKLAELGQALLPLGSTLIPQSELKISDAIEDGLSFIENALLKARHASKASDMPALADDSGLEVDVLDGAPGIYSARFCEMRESPYAQARSDQNNVAALLETLRDRNAFAHKPVTAHYQCVLCFVRHWDDPTPLLGIGSWSGEIIEEASGSGGFGYDPIFYSAEDKLTAAQLSKEQKRERSHRTHALNDLQQKWLARYS